MNRFPTPKENIVLDLLFEWLHESRFNRTMQEYIAIAARVPKTAAVHAYVNQRLREMAAGGHFPYEICYFKVKDRYHWYAPFPTSLSIETVRTALKKFGLAELRRLAKAAA
jgi:hypothetical protein